MHVCACPLLHFYEFNSKEYGTSDLRLSTQTDRARCCSRRPIPVNNSLFEGEVRVWISGLPTTPDGFATEVMRMTCRRCDWEPRADASRCGSADAAVVLRGTVASTACDNRPAESRKA